MREQILNSIDEMVAVLEKDFDVVIKKMKDGNIKVLFYKPKRLKKERRSVKWVKLKLFIKMLVS